MDKRQGVAVLAEVVAVLARYPGLRCAPVVDIEDGVVALTVSVDTQGADGLRVLALHDELKYVADVAQVRAICSSYDVKPEQLEALLPAMQDDAPPGVLRCLTVAEIEAVVAILRDFDTVECAADALALADSALPKLVLLARALAGAV